MLAHQLECDFSIFFLKILVSNKGRISHNNIKFFLVINTILIICKEIALDNTCPISTSLLGLSFVQLDTSYISFNGLIRCAHLL